MKERVLNCHRKELNVSDEQWVRTVFDVDGAAAWKEQELKIRSVQGTCKRLRRLWWPRILESVLCVCDHRMDRHQWPPLAHLLVSLHHDCLLHSLTISRLRQLVPDALLQPLGSDVLLSCCVYLQLKDMSIAVCSVTIRLLSLLSITTTVPTPLHLQSGLLSHSTKAK